MSTKCGADQHYAVILNQTDRLASLLNDTDVNVTNRYGQTPLILSVHYNRPTACAILISHESSLHHIDNDNNSALYYAVKAELFTIIHQLINAGADISVLYQHGESMHVFPHKDSILDKYLIWVSANPGKKCYYFLIDLLYDLTKNNFSLNYFASTLSPTQQLVKDLFKNPAYRTITPENVLEFLNRIIAICRPTLAALDQHQHQHQHQQEIINFSVELLKAVNCLDEAAPAPTMAAEDVMAIKLRGSK